MPRIISERDSIESAYILEIIELMIDFLSQN